LRYYVENLSKETNSRYTYAPGSFSGNSFGFKWFEVIDSKVRAKEYFLGTDENKVGFKSVRRNSKDNMQHTLGIAFKRLL
jgi:hypothetical protein